MTVREKMIQYRKDHYITLEKMAEKLEITGVLLDIVERGGVTHPEIVKRMKKAYHLTDEESYELLPTIRRPGHPDYDPDHFVIELDPNMMLVMPKQDEIERYITENNYRQSKKGIV